MTVIGSVTTSNSSAGLPELHTPHGNAPTVNKVQNSLCSSFNVPFMVSTGFSRTSSSLWMRPRSNPSRPSEEVPSGFGSQTPGLSFRRIRDLLKRGRFSDDAEQSASWKESARLRSSKDEDGLRVGSSLKAQGIDSDRSVSELTDGRSVSKSGGELSWSRGTRARSSLGNAGESSAQSESLKRESSLEGHESMAPLMAKRVNDTPSKRSQRMMTLRFLGCFGSYVKNKTCKPSNLLDLYDGPKIEEF